MSKGKNDKPDSSYPDFIWQDRDVRFDSKPALLECRKGEKLIDSINSVEDTKGNNGERGSLIVTNLRLIWVSHNKSKINLSIGYSTMISVNIRKAKSKLKGDTQALCIMAKFGSKFEFVFTSLVKNSPRLFTTVQAVVRAYETSKLYRDLKLRGSIIRENELIKLPLETIYTKLVGVWNLSSDQKTIRVRDSKFGKALVLETFTRAGGYILGFRVDPIEKLDELLDQLNRFYSLFSHSPVFGVEYTIEGVTDQTTSNIQTPLIRVDEDVEVIEEAEDTHVLAAYYADGATGGEEDDDEHERIQYDESIGLAVERMQDGLTLDSLWHIT